MEPGLIILIVTLVAFAGMVTFMLLTGFKNQWPQGERTTLEKSLLGKLHLIVGPGDSRRQMEAPTTDEEIARHLDRAVNASVEGWLQATKENKRKEAKEIVVYLLGDTEYDKYTEQPGSNATIRNVLRRIGHGPHIVVMRSKLLNHAMSTGEPVIHEMMHILGGDYNHSDLMVWNEFETSPASAQSLAQRKFRQV